MDWLLNLSVAHESQSKVNFKKLQKFTLYDQNCISDIDEEAQTFKCVLNCKRMNRMYSTVCQIEGDLKIGLIDISCRLLDQQHIIHGQWEYQRIELTRFAFRYNERSYRNIYIRTNPLNGEVAVTLSFMTGSSILQDDQKFREYITDLCHTVGQESEMIFNTMLEIIFGREANEPYLKSAIKVNPGFPRYMKVEKLLDKVKSLIATSNFYKIRSDISTAHKNRSYFKKIFLNQDKKYITNSKIVQLALAYEIKFNKKYEDAQKKSRDRDKPIPFIKDYIQLEQKNEIQFAKHLNQQADKLITEKVLNKDPVQNITFHQQTNLYTLQYPNNVVVQATGRSLSQEQYQHQITILTLMDLKHNNISKCFAPAKPQRQIANHVFYLYQREIPLQQFLNRNRKTISLSTKLHIMSQVCSVIQFLHKRKIGYFIRMENIYITQGLQIRVRGFEKAYKVLVDWVDNKKQGANEDRCTHLLIRRQNFKTFPYLFLNEKDLDNQKCDILSIGICLYLILMDKFPFNEKQVIFNSEEITPDEWLSHWVVQTEYYLAKGGEIVKIIAHLLLKCLDIKTIFNRPYVEWLLVILCEIRTSLNGLY